ncbi:hypothetical protein [Candidatus Nitrotoga arctica]|uniref:Uncharacterized protein n=1 Tax=Candidatus Nitrotoga arctica TaxID=453162 RepID=A0ABM8Z2T1_9PROT|nr:hypothetical protein [Candidatus Nitrotoga arctica]CAG9934202.1 protein of unknown function [Candidatus Nitrotoga arctica]
MAVHHGVYLAPQGTHDSSTIRPKGMQFRYGILRVFEGLRSGSFLASPDDRRRAAELEHHFRNVCQRLLFSLQRLDALMQQLTTLYVPGQAPNLETMRVHFEAETVADHLMSYLNMVVDDIAVMITQATGYLPSKPTRAVDSFGKLRRAELRLEAAFQPIKTLLDATDVAGSWWDLGFATGTGARQLVIHNQHLIDFQLSSVPGGPIEARAIILSPHALEPFPCTDYFGLLHRVLGGLFAWLDDVERVLILHLKAVDSSWQPMSFCPGFSLPVGYPLGITRYSKEYFPVPACDGSEELPWSIEVCGPKA